MRASSIASAKRVLLASGRLILFVLVVGYPVGYLAVNADDEWPSAIALLVFSLVFVIVVDRRSWQSFGLTLDRNGLRDTGIGILVPLVQLSFILLVEMSAGWARVQLSRDPGLHLGRAAWQWAGVAFQEELIDRGYVFQVLLCIGGRRFGPFLALSLSAAFFGVMHSGNPHASTAALILLTVSGFEYAIAYLVTGRLWLPIALHFSWNFVEGTLFGFPVSGSTWPSLLLVKATGPIAWTGGSFGPEAGILALIASLSNIVFMLCLARTGFWRRAKLPHEIESQRLFAQRESE